MSKKLFFYVSAFTLLFFAIYYSQQAILNQIDTKIRFNIWETNLFFAVSSLLICIHFEVFSFIDKLKPQLGFIYLPTLFIKGIIFFAAFKSSIFNLETLTDSERLNLLLPFLFFLGLEVLFVVRIIKKTEV